MNRLFIYTSIAVLLLGVSGWWFFMHSTSVPIQDTLEPRAVPENTRTIIAFGDSLTAGYGVLQREAYPAQLEEALQEAGYAVRIINAGVSGETTRGNVERVNFIRSQDPDIIIIGIGGNDALRSLPIEETEKNIRETIQILGSGENPPQLLLLQMKAPLNAGTLYKAQFDTLYVTIANDENIPLVPFIVEDIFLDPTNKISDGIHYNKIGYQKVVLQYILPQIKEVLDTPNL
ncbi:arylesterase [Candidatus Kaiserbacteria bacterium]|nr:MAG: arylesterase [Candidatus Kaiserbacteria bacterium]